jgi:glycosyltransferase involved in cell wall biosynthesis
VFSEVPGFNHGIRAVKTFLEIAAMAKKIDILIPCYNESNNILQLVHQIDHHIKGLGYDYELTFIDDGSTDSTYEIINDLSKKRENIHGIRLSRNFGKEAAMKSGIDFCDADAAILMDADLQHPPFLIPRLISEWERGAQIVDAVKITRQKENVFKKYLTLLFYKIISRLTKMDLSGSSDYKLIDRKVINILKTLNERDRFFRGLTHWVGLQHCKIDFKVEERKTGTSKWNSSKLLRLSSDAILSYTSKPLYAVVLLGIGTLVFSVILGAQTLYNKIYGNAVSGFTTVILIILITASFIMMSLGMIGLYLSKIYDEIKGRPIYIVEKSTKSFHQE